MGEIPISQLGTSDYLRNVRRAWERFVSASPIEEAGIRKVVLDSWKRCRAQGVNPAARVAPLGVSEDDLAQLYDANATFWNALRLCLPRITPQLADAGTVLIATDPQGIVLSVEGDPELAVQLSAIHATPGACWAEGGSGTNAIGTALALQRPVLVHAQEHFCEGAKVWSCTAGIVRDPIDGSVLGVVDVTGPHDAPVLHAGPLVTLLIERLQAQLAERAAVERAQLLERFADLVAPSEAAFMLDARGRVVKATGGANAALRAHGVARPLRPGARISGLGGENGAETTARLPDWVRPEWLEPLHQGRDRLGALLRLPRCNRANPPASLALAPPLAQLAASSPSLAPLLHHAQRFAAAAIPILLQGETGTGKDVLGAAIHAASPRRGGPFIAVNSAALPREMLASELFGYAEGAFTGARRGGAKGRFEQASGGTLFLDEIGDMPIDAQPYLLRVLEEKAVWRLGESGPRHLDVRVIAATNHDLADDVAAGRFRADLYHRLNVASLILPPLRERKGDIPALVADILSRLAPAGMQLAPDALDALLRHDWPGNVRELRNTLERMALLAEDGVLRHADIGAPRPTPPPSPPPVGHGATAHVSRTLKAAEQDTILAALHAAGGNVSGAARALGVSRATLYRRLGSYDAITAPRRWQRTPSR